MRNNYFIAVHESNEPDDKWFVSDELLWTDNIKSAMSFSYWEDAVRYFKSNEKELREEIAFIPIFHPKVCAVEMSVDIAWEE